MRLIKMTRTVTNPFVFAVLLALTSASVSSLLTSCSTAQVSEADPAALYKDAEDDIKNDHYQIAIDKLRAIRNKFPYSKYAVDAQLRLADVYFLQEDFAEAAAAYETFRDLHPKHEKAPYAMFRIGKSYYKDSPTNVARDLTPAQKSLDAYQDYLRRYPNATDAQEARDDLEAARRLLADKELYIGNFYYKRDFYDSAKPRFQRVISLYPETPAAKEAQEKLGKISDYESKHPKAEHKGNEQNG
jgi:outer membrane protein assembly factor BamD